MGGWVGLLSPPGTGADAFCSHLLIVSKFSSGGAPMGLSPGAKHDGWRRDKKGDSIHSGHKLVLLQTLWSHLTFRSPPPERGLSPTGWQLAGDSGWG